MDKKIADFCNQKNILTQTRILLDFCGNRGHFEGVWESFAMMREYSSNLLLFYERCSKIKLIGEVGKHWAILLLCKSQMEYIILCVLSWALMAKWPHRDPGLSLFLLCASAILCIELVNWEAVIYYDLSR